MALLSFRISQESGGGKGEVGSIGQAVLRAQAHFSQKTKKKASCLIIEHKPVQNKNGSR